MQALLTLLSSAPKIALVVGLDRDKVAAALAAKQEKLLPYLYNVEAKDTFTVGMQYGHRFLEKFIQLSYSLPVPRPSGLKAMINPAVSPPDDFVPESDKSPDAIRIVNGEDDSQTLNQCIDMAGEIFDYNPRNVKQFINAFRLQTFIANETGLLGSSVVTRTGRPLTLPQLAKFVALCMRWPRLIEESTTDPELLKTLESWAVRDRLMANQEEEIPREMIQWLKDQNLLALLSFGEGVEEFALANVNFRKLGEIVPLQPARSAS